MSECGLNFSRKKKIKIKKTESGKKSNLNLKAKNFKIIRQMLVLKFKKIYFSKGTTNFESIDGKLLRILVASLFELYENVASLNRYDTY